MIRFNNDYNRGAHPAVLRALQESASGSFDGYGADVWCGRAAELIRELSGQRDAGVYFFPGATQANLVFLAAALRPTQSVVSADSGHIYCHEAGSIENTGHKILALPAKDGKISAEQLRRCASAYYDEGEPEYLTEPKAVYLSFPTETGTIYTLSELEALREVCGRYGMYLFVDGARLGYGLAAPGNDVTLRDLGRLADAFYIGGTKCGALFGEAFVLSDRPLQKRFRSHMKQCGAVFAKSWLMGLQFFSLLEDGSYFEAARRADEQALSVRAAFSEKGIPLCSESCTNQQFVLLTEEQEAALGRDFLFELSGRAEDGGTVARFCTSWATSDEEAAALISAIRAL